MHASLLFLRVAAVGLLVAAGCAGPVGSDTLSGPRATSEKTMPTAPATRANPP